MKCKNWSNKINNFVARRLKSIKITGQVQQQVTLTTSTTVAVAAVGGITPSTTTAATTSTTTVTSANISQLQQYTSTCSIMPAMPKEKAAAVSLNESNFSELKLKELNTTSSATITTNQQQQQNQHITTMAAKSPFQHYQLQQQQQQQQQQQHQHNSHHHNNQQNYQQQNHRSNNSSSCGCGAASAPLTTTNDSSINMNNRYTNGYATSPLAVAMSSKNQTYVFQTMITSINNTTTSSPQRIANTCCRLQYKNGQRKLSAATIETNIETNNYNTTTAATEMAAPTTNNAEASISNNSDRIITTTTAATTVTVPTAAPAPPPATTPPKKSNKDFIFGKFIGEGSFSNVFLAACVHTRREYAIKVCEKRHIIKEGKQEYIRREREVLNMMTNVPGFVNLSCTFQDARSLYFVMTYAKNGDLLPYINKVGSFDVDCTRHYAAELVLACEEMHKRNLIHRDLKPENILLDEDMHTLIADFGSARILTDDDINYGKEMLNKYYKNKYESDDNMKLSQRTAKTTTDDNDDDSDDKDDDNDDNNRSIQNQQHREFYRKRRGSFVGTAQYLSPEVLKNGPMTPAVDLWALGCIIYQMISGLPPFRGNNDWLIFKQIEACNVDFPDGFDKDAEDLVKKLLKFNPFERLGALEGISGNYQSLRTHPFFRGINFDTLRDERPPPIYPYLPGVTKDEQFLIPDNLEPGLDDRQVTRLLGMELGTSQMEKKTKKTAATTTNEIKNEYDLSEKEKQICLEEQKTDKWHVFTDNEVILKKGFVNKRKGLFARRRMLLLTTGPRLIYIDPVQMVKKGEIPWSADLSVEPKNFKIFFVHTPNRTYYLEGPEGSSPEWVEAIEKMHDLIYKTSTTTTTTAATATAASVVTTTTTKLSSTTTKSSSK